MDELIAIELLKKVLLGEREEKKPNSIQASKTINTVIYPEPSSRNQIRRSKSISEQDIQDGRIACLAAKETASIPDLTINSRKIKKGLGRDNMNLQLNE